MKYKSIVVTQRGGPETVRIVENELRLPRPQEARVRILGAPVCQDDVAARVGNRPFRKKPPFVPGYSCIGDVDAIGEKVTGINVGDRVAALTQFGSHAQFIYVDGNALVHVPESLKLDEAAALTLNYLVAYQVLHRVARVKAGDQVLIIGASGGVGTAFLQLGKVAGLKMYGLASAAKHAELVAHGAVPIDYHTQDFVEIIKQDVPQGLNFVFNGMGEEYFARGLAVLQPGGMLVTYGAPQSFAHFLLLAAKLILYNLLPNGKTIKGYGTHRLGTELFKEDWRVLYSLLVQGRIKPIIAGRFPLMGAADAYRLLENGTVTGNLVLLTPELL